MPLSMELITMLGSALFSGLMTMWSMKLKAKAQEQKALIERATLENDIFTRAREYKGNKGFQFTRRTIALLCIFSIIVLPLVMAGIAPIFGWDITVNYGYTAIESGFWFWSDDETVVKWVAVSGLTITPMHSQIVSSIIGMYFGNSVVKNA